MSDDCLFCSIVAGDIPSQVVLEDDDVFAFRDIAPAAQVHVLVVPKRHIADARDVGPEHGDLVAAMVRAGNRVAEQEEVASSGYRLIFNVGPDAGQTVFHLHLHVLGGHPLGPMAS